MMLEGDGFSGFPVTADAGFNSEDAALADRHTVVLQHRVGGIDRNDPAGVNEGVAGPVGAHEGLAVGGKEDGKFTPVSV